MDFCFFDYLFKFILQLTADFSTRNLAKAAAIYQREIFPLLTILLTVAVTFIGLILTHYGFQMA